MKKSLLLSVSLAALSTSAVATDLTVRPARPETPVAKPYSWSGFYGGAHVGYGWGNESDSQRGLFPPVRPTAAPPVVEPTLPPVEPTLPPVEPTIAPTPTPLPTELPIGQQLVVVQEFIKDTHGISSYAMDEHIGPKGFVGGLHFGYNYQINQFVLGAEGDFDYTSIQGSRAFSYDTSNGAIAGTLKLKSDWQGSARLRLGYAIDNFLLYATGGIAFADAQLQTNGLGSSRTHVGWTAGGGVEYAFTQNWIGRVEARYTDFDRQTYQTPLGPVRVKWDETTATVGISYKF